VTRRLALVVSALFVAGSFTAAAVAATRLPGVRTPSGNVTCLYVPGAGKLASGSLLCQVRKADYSKTLQAHCIAPPTSLDWHGFQLGATRSGAVVCSGGILYNPATQRPSYVTLRAGRTWRHGAFTCHALVAGVTCTNRVGHGLLVSRLAWRAW
jgi:hypothetical protein